MNYNITNKIEYIGVNDKTLDLFESQYIVPNGISYNSYLIMDEKIAIMDTIDRRKTDTSLQNLENELLYMYYTKNYTDFKIIPFSFNL